STRAPRVSARPRQIRALEAIERGREQQAADENGDVTGGKTPITSPGAARRRSVDREAVEEPVAAGALQIRLAAAARGVRRVPRSRILPAARAVVVTDHRAAVRRAARPVRARVLRGRAVLERAGQDAAHVRRLA